MDQGEAGRDHVTVPAIIEKKRRGEKIAALTAYDYPTARLLDEAGIDIILVGDSLGNAVLGYENTLPVTLDEIIAHTRAVARGARRSLVVADMPFGSFNVSAARAVENAVRCIKEGGAAAVKIEGGQKRAALVCRLVEADIPVMGHVGLTPQSLHLLGGYKVCGRSASDIRKLVEDALAIEEAGAFSIVLESIPWEVAALITERLKIPTIGIGAGQHCDGQILVVNDILGLSFGHVPRFVRKYTDVAAAMRQAFQSFIADVRSSSFPLESESYKLASPLELDQALKRG